MLAGFRELNDLPGDRVTGRTNVPVGSLEGHKGNFESDAQKTDGLRVESVSVQVGPDRHND